MQVQDISSILGAAGKSGTDSFPSRTLHQSRVEVIAEKNFPAFSMRYQEPIAGARV